MIDMEYIKEVNPEFVVLDGFDDCVIGVCEKIGKLPCLCYDAYDIIQKLQSKGMSEEGAVEYFEYNIMGLYAGKSTPIFLFRYEK